MGPGGQRSESEVGFLRPTQVTCEARNSLCRKEVGIQEPVVLSCLGQPSPQPPPGKACFLPSLCPRSERWDKPSHVCNEGISPCPDHFPETA